MKIPFPEFTAVIKAYFPDCHIQDLMPAREVHVWDSTFLQEEFWPKWREIVRIINAQLPNAPLCNNVKRGICDEITKRFVAECALSTRQKYGDEDVAPGVLETSVIIPVGYSLNLAPGYGAHRTIIAALKTDDTIGWQPFFVEPQLEYSQYETTKLDDALIAGVITRECWL